MVQNGSPRRPIDRSAVPRCSQGRRRRRWSEQRSAELLGLAPLASEHGATAGPGAEAAMVSRVREDLEVE